MPINENWFPKWLVPQLTQQDTNTKLPEWFAAAFRERVAIGNIKVNGGRSTAPAKLSTENASKDLFAAIGNIKTTNRK